MQRYSSGDDMGLAFDAAIQQQQRQQRPMYEQAQLKRQMNWADDDFYS